MKFNKILGKCCQAWCPDPTGGAEKMPQRGQGLGGKRKILKEENSVAEDRQYLKEADGRSQQ